MRAARARLGPCLPGSHAPAPSSHLPPWPPPHSRSAPTPPQEAERREAETEANRGVYFHAHMQAAPTSAAAAAARGIKRALDKLVLPSSVGGLLMAQEAFKNGVRARAGRRRRKGAGTGAALGAARLRRLGPTAFAPARPALAAARLHAAPHTTQRATRLRPPGFLQVPNAPPRPTPPTLLAQAMLFEVSAPNGARTHAGVLEFSPDVPDGVVLLPDKVQDCLWGLARQGDASGVAGGSEGGFSGSEGAGGAGGTPGAARGSSGGGGGGDRCAGKVHVSYRRLEKGTYVRLQPELRSFHDEVGADPDAMKRALEDALHAVCALTEGDWVQVGAGRGAGWAGRAVAACCGLRVRAGQRETGCVWAVGPGPTAGMCARAPACTAAAPLRPPVRPRLPRRVRPCLPTSTLLLARAARCRLAARCTTCACWSCSRPAPSA